MPTAVVYCRVSSDEQAQKDISIPAQRKAIHRWAQAQGNMEIVQDFIDEGESAYAPAARRPAFCEMVAFCRKTKPNHILVHKLDRFSRNREESILFKSLLRKEGVTVRSITETYDPETPQGFLYESMIEAFNEFYSMNLATETMKGMRENAERGFHNGGRIPYGYRLERVAEGKTTHGHLVVGPKEEVDVVKEIFDRSVNQGWGMRRIAESLNLRHIPAPTGGQWSFTAVHWLVSNPVYVGDEVWFKSRRDGREGRANNPPEKWIVTPDAHEAIIERETFEKRKAVAQERPFNRAQAPARHVNYLLARLIRCDHCGHHFAGRRGIRSDRKGKKWDVYHYNCSGYLNKSRAVCDSMPLDRAWVEGLVLRIIRARLCAPGALEEMERRMMEKVEARRKTYGMDSRTADLRLADFDRKIDNYYRAIGEGLDPVQCRQMVAELQEKKKVLEAEAEVLRSDEYYRKSLEKNIAELRRFATAFDEGFTSLPFEVQRQVVLYFIKDMVLVDRKELHITMRIPFDNQGIKILTDEVQAAGSGEGGLEGGLTRGSESSLSDTGRHPLLDAYRTWCVEAE